MTEKQWIEKATAEGFVAAYNALMGTSYRFDALLDPPEPDARCVDTDGNSFCLEITMTEDRPGDIKSQMGRSEDRSLQALKVHLDAVKAGKASIFDRLSSSTGNAGISMVQRLRSKLTKSYGPGVALIIRDTSGVDWDWDVVKGIPIASLDLSQNPYDMGIWVLSHSKDRLFRLA